MNPEEFKKSIKDLTNSVPKNPKLENIDTALSNLANIKTILDEVTDPQNPNRLDDYINDLYKNLNNAIEELEKINSNHQIQSTPEKNNPSNSNVQSDPEEGRLDIREFC